MAIPKGWTLETLSSVVIPDGLQTGPFGSQLKASEYATDGVPVIMPKDMKNGRVSTASIARIPEEVAESRLSPHRTQSGDLLFARRGEIGRCALITSQELGWVCGTGCLRARPGRKVHPAFLIHQILDAKATRWLTDMAVGQTMLNLNTQILSELPIALPPLPEQKKIAAVLSSVDAAIEKTEAVIAQLQVVKKAMMEQLLTKGMPGRHTRFKQTELGEIPEEWEVVGLFDVASINPGQVDPRFSEFQDLPLIAPNHIETGTGKLIAVESAASQNAISGKYPISVDDVIYCKIRPYLRKAWLSTINGLCSADMYPLRCSSRLIPQFLLAVLLSDRFTNFTATQSGRTGIPKINREELSLFQFGLPTKSEQFSIAQHIDATTKSYMAECQTLVNLHSLKSSLSSSLLSGELRVPTESVPCPV